jgi:UDP-N-acetylglucosamine diphosphorylase/glucosamine-1-phosphate N-acetyltransferase
MEKAIHLFDDPKITQNLRPISYIRSLAEHWIGLSKIHEKWSQATHKKVSWGAAEIQPNALHILGSVPPSQELIRELENLPEQTNLYFQGQLIAQRGLGVSSADWNNINSQANPVFFSKFEDLLSLNAALLKKEIKPNAFDQNHLKENGNILIHPENCFIDATADLKGSILDASQGPIYIGKHAIIQIGTLIQGPAAILDHSVTNLGAKIRPFTTIAPHCKVGGEISNSIFYPFSNKGHDGYAGSSIIGSFCNWGAMTCTSNVKNDLNEVDIFDYSTAKPRKTNTKSLGVIMGDFVTTGIGTRFNTGTVVGNHCNISGIQFLPKFIPSLTWGEYPNVKKYEFEKALANAKKWAKAKNQELPENSGELIEQIWKEEASLRN